jgi:sulfite exporter TauE/SafE
MQDLSLVFLVGLLGSAHCVGMCGGLIAGVAMSGPRDALHLRQAAYLGGKTLAYAVFGALAGALGVLAGTLLAGVQGALTLALGLVLIVVGLALCGVGQRWARALPLADRIAQPLTALIGRLLQRGDAQGLVGLGFVNGLLPCALVYGMLAKAATTGSAVGGALTMAVFGLGTVPALYLTGLLGARLPVRWRQRMQVAGGVLVVALGVLTAARAATALGVYTPAEGTVQHEWLCVPGLN